MNPAIFSAPQNPMVRLDATLAALRREGKEIFDFGIGDPLEPTPPFLIEALRAAVPAVGQYPRVVGTPALRQAIAGYLQRRFGVSLDPETQLLPNAGAKEAIFHLPLCAIDPKAKRRVVVYPDPGYPIYERGTVFAQAEPHPVVLRSELDFRIEPEELPADLLDRTALFWICSPNNPTGAVAPRDYFERVAAAARRHGFLVASDECYADLYFDEPPPSYLEVATEGVLAIHSLSKRSGMTGIRSGFMAGDRELIAALKRFRPAIGTASPEFVQAAAAVAWSDDAHAAERRAIIGQKRAVFLALFERLGWMVRGSAAGLYLWVEVPRRGPETVGDEVGFAERLAQRTGIVVQPGSYLGAGGVGYFRLALSPTLAQCQRAADLWWRDHARS